MKNIVFLCTLILLVSACKKEATTLAKPSNNESKATVSIDAIVDSALQNTTARSSVQCLRGWYNNEIVKNPGYQYIWVVIDQGSLPQAPRVKLYGPDHQTRYRTMQRSSNGAYWYLVSSLPKTGHYAWRYVSHNYTDLTSWNSWIDNTKVRINLNGTSNLVWPFGAEDGSSWSNPGHWKGTNYGHCGHQQPFKHAQDWNWKAGNSDKGKILLAPVSGFVKHYVTSNGNKLLSIDQAYGNDEFRFQYAHIDQYIATNNSYVMEGSPIGTLGCTGLSCLPPYTAHAHCGLYHRKQNKVPVPEQKEDCSGTYSIPSIPIDFSAQ